MSEVKGMAKNTIHILCHLAIVKPIRKNAAVDNNGEDNEAKYATDNDHIELQQEGENETEN